MRVVCLVPRFLVGDLEFRSVPAVHVLRGLDGDVDYTNLPFRFFLGVDEVRCYNATLCAGDFFRLLRANVIAIAVITRVHVEVFANRVASDGVRASRGLVRVVRAWYAPYVTLA